ncbi:MAG: PLP-dependent aminotransferase family protein [Verrucomicrobiota bacterium]
MKNSPLSSLARRTGPPPISWLMQLALSRPQLISLAAGFTDNESLPVAEVSKTVGDILRHRKSALPALQYGTTQGDPTLRELTARRLQHLDGAKSAAAYSSERMLITNGSQQFLYMVTEALCDPGDIVIVEDPTYFVYLGILQSHGVQARGVRMEADGLDLDHLEALLTSLQKRGQLSRLKALYLVSYFQNPTGITTSFAKKVAALKLLKKFERAAGHPIYLLEDAAYRELRFGHLTKWSAKPGDLDQPPVNHSKSSHSPRPSGERAGERGSEKLNLLTPALSSFGGGEGDATSRAFGERSALAAKGFGDRVIYTSTYSKPFATGARIGFGALPEPLFTAVLRIKGNHDFGSANLLQQLLARALASGRYEHHLHALQQRYARKAATMRAALQKYFPPEVQWAEATGGLYFWAKLPRGVATGPKSKLFQAALAKDVFYVPGVLCYAEDSSRRQPAHEMRLSFGGASEENIREGVKRLGAVLTSFVI